MSIFQYAAGNGVKIAFYLPPEARGHPRGGRSFWKGLRAALAPR